jgi:hypothetical protein
MSLSESYFMMPQNLSVVYQNSTEALVSWNPPDPFENRSIVTGFSIFVDDVLIAETTETEFTLPNLILNQYYIIGISVTYNDGESNAVSVDYNHSSADAENDVNDVTKLIGNYPNPFNPSTKILFSLKDNTEDNTVNTYINIYNTRGQRIKTFSNLQNNKSSTQEVIWNGEDETGSKVSSGVYLYKFVSGDVSQTKKMLLIK